MLIASSKLSRALRAEDAVCLTEEECLQKFLTMKTGGRFFVGEYPDKGCFLKNVHGYFGTGGTDEEISKTNLQGTRERIWCDVETEEPTLKPSNKPTDSPTDLPTTEAPSSEAPSSEAPTPNPSYSPTSESPTSNEPTLIPTTKQPTLKPTTTPPSSLPTKSPSKAPVQSLMTAEPTTSSPVSESDVDTFITKTQLQLTGVYSEMDATAVKIFK